jgi:hypothetical protein
MCSQGEWTEVVIPVVIFVLNCVVETKRCDGLKEMRGHVLERAREAASAEK